MKRSNAPIFWSLFGAGGMLAALVGIAFVVVTGFMLPRAALDHATVAALARHAALPIFAVIALFLWHAAHRIFHTLHDLGVHAGALAKTVCYGGAATGTAVTAWLLSLLR